MKLSDYRNLQNGSSERQALNVLFFINPASPLSQSFGVDVVEAALERFAALKDDVHATITTDAQAFDSALARTHVLVLVGPANLDDLEKRATRLGWIHFTSAGVDTVPLKSIPAKILVTNARGNHGKRAAEFSATALLMLNNRIPEFMTWQRDRTWCQTPLESIEGKTVAIMGMGALGSSAAEAAKRLGLRVRGISRSGATHRNVDQSFNESALRSALTGADFLLVTLPLTRQTRGIIGRAELDFLPKHGGVINIGRGPVIDYDALAGKLRAGELRGAVMDVFPDEPLQASSPLWNVPNLIVIPHSGLYDLDYGRRCLDSFLSNLKSQLDGLPPVAVVDREQGY